MIRPGTARQLAGLTLVRGVSLRWPSGLAIAFCGLLGVLLPAAFGQVAGAPEPGVHDEFSYLLSADTFAHGRLTNPPLPLPEFFEAPHILVTPTYNSKYPPGQGLVMALGQVIGGQPVWGVWVSCGLFAASLCWMLQAWTSRQWALATTVVAIVTIGVSTYWAQSYWGGMLAAAGSALLFGGMRRTWRSPALMPSVLMAFGVLILANTRPYEGLFVCIAAGAVLGWWLLRNREVPLRIKLTSWMLPFAVTLAAGVVLMATYNHALTGHWLKTPYEIHQAQYSPQDVFLFSVMRTPDRTPVERVAQFYRHSSEVPERGWRLAWRAARHLFERLPATIESALGIVDYPGGGREAYRGVLLWMLAIVMLFARDRWFRFCIATVLFVLLGGTLVRWWHAHYTAPLVPLVLAAVAMTLNQAGRSAAGSYWPRRAGPPVVVTLAACYLVMPFVMNRLPQARPVEVAEPAPLRPTSYLSRSDLRRELERRAGSHLVFVAYADDFTTQRGEWVYNLADLNEARVIFAHDLGNEKNSTLIAAYPRRAVWLVRVSNYEAPLSPYP